MEIDCSMSGVNRSVNPPCIAAGKGHMGDAPDRRKWAQRLHVQRLRVKPILIEPGRPDQNGRHERFHETLKAETASPPSPTVRAQQGSFDRFQTVYNEERPHEALGMKTPAEVYELSPREMPTKLPEHEYPSGYEVRRVRPDGAIKWAGERVFVGEALAGEALGIEAAGEGLWHVHLGPLRIGILHGRSKTVVPPPTGVTHVPGHGKP